MIDAFAGLQEEKKFLEIDLLPHQSLVLIYADGHKHFFFFYKLFQVEVKGGKISRHLNFTSFMQFGRRLFFLFILECKVVVVADMLNP